MMKLGIVACVAVLNVAVVAFGAFFFESSRPPTSYSCDCPESTPWLSFFSACPQLSSWQNDFVNAELSLASASIPFLQYTPILNLLAKRETAQERDWRRPLLLYVPGMVWLTILVIDVVFKPMFKQPRPMNVYARPCTSGAAQNGMPSGHSAIAVVVACVVTVSKPSSSRGWWAVLMGAWYVLVVTSRLVFLYHTPAQVFWGSMVGAAVSCGVSLLVGWPLAFRAAMPRHRMEHRLLAAVCAILTFGWTPLMTWPNSSTAQTRAVGALVCSCLPFVVVAVRRG